MATVLIVDDEPDILGVVAAAVHRRLGIPVEVAHSGEAAKAKLLDNGYKLVVTDQRMPGMEGTELLQWLRSEKPECRRVLMTAFNGPELERQAEAAGAEMVLKKPFKLDQFVESLRVLLAAT